MIKTLLLTIHILFYKKCPRKNLIDEDVEHWKENLQWNGSSEQIIKKLLLEKEEFRNLFYYRLGNAGGFLPILKVIAPPLSSLYIWTSDIGGGLFIQHGFATVIAAKKIGIHCSINQQVTIGYIGKDAPVIGDYTIITCGAKVLGGIKVGNHVKIGANAVVIKDIPDDTTVVGIPAYIVKRNGRKTHEEL